MHLAEWLPLKQVAMRAPADAVRDQIEIDLQWRQLNYLRQPDFNKAACEHGVFRGVLREAGAEIIDLDAGSGLTLDSIYVRDTALVVPGGVIITTMGKGARQAEPNVLADLLTLNGIQIAGEISPPGMLEGGDCVWIDETTLLIGRTYRTNEAGIRQVREILGPAFDVLAFDMPHYKGANDVFHLMSVLSPIDHDAAVVYLPLMPVPLVEYLMARDFRLLEIPDHEFDSMGCNILALGNQKVVLVGGNPGTSAILRAAGFEAIEISGDHICHPGQGGPTCLTLPLRRGFD